MKFKSYKMFKCSILSAFFLVSINTSLLCQSTPTSSNEMEIDSLLNGRGLISPEVKISIPVNPNGRGFMRDAAKEAYAKFKSLFTGDMMEATYHNFTSRYTPRRTYLSKNSKENFLQNILEILKYNLGALTGKLMFTKGINLFTDMTPEEVRQKYTGAIILNTSASAQTGRSIFNEGDTPGKIPAYHPLLFSGSGRALTSSDPVLTPPPQMDWRTLGIVTIPKQQGECASCTSFALTAGLESAMGLYKGVTGLDLSEQELLDCATGPGIYRCSGNWPEDMYKYQETYGQTQDSSYPYVTRVTPCRAAETSRVAKVAGFYKAPPGDEETLRKWVGIYGVHSAVVQVDESFIQYNGGIMDVPCDNSRLDHSVLIVGYGTDPDLGMDYWIIKNSWGHFWGEAGFIRIARNKGNLCRISDYAILVQA